MSVSEIANFVGSGLQREKTVRKRIRRFKRDLLSTNSPGAEKGPWSSPWRALSAQPSGNEASFSRIEASEIENNPHRATALEKFC
jgi:hypothetical protein